MQGTAFGLGPNFRVSYATATEVLEDACTKNSWSASARASINRGLRKVFVNGYEASAGDCGASGTAALSAARKLACQ